ncbi:EEP domain-containing protein [Rhizobiales bacterium RZME27]|uniref:EEP domain-containing protein n=1 Tax=Endobacterium cereale TaxID=2663029 RepID=A0A6A8A5W0_9HYPH|nr:endonuclease/exonuclease/phosphatase family protein [Endobacterium cereale]MEB2847902.1 endonuclease/exonuclease/phosphatase family protein [Endobacterium cereale]MQY46762.1 EEP domain-containing protein [Endobacterium cereale]
MIEKRKKEFSVLTYNVHGCVGTDRQLDIDRVAAVIQATDADIVMLQELDVGRQRSGGADQAHELAARLEMAYHFNAALHIESEQYGDAILTRHPMELIRAGHLSSVGETRGAIWVEVTVGDQTLNVINTHLGLRRSERLAQIRELHGPDWLGNDRCQQNPTIFGGDLNAVPSSQAFRNVKLQTQICSNSRWRRYSPTFPSRYPLLRLDHIFHSQDLEMTAIAAIDSGDAKIASDHLPLLAQLCLEF